MHLCIYAYVCMFTYLCINICIVYKHVVYILIEEIVLFSRQVVARGLFETLVSLEDSQEETDKVFHAMSKLSYDQG